MRPEKQTTQAIMERLNDYQEVIPLIVDGLGLSDRLENIDEILFLHPFKNLDGSKSEIDAKIISNIGNLLVWIEFKLNKDFSEIQLQNEYNTLEREARNKNLDYVLIGVSDHRRKPYFFTGQKMNGKKYEWVSYEKIRKSFTKFAKDQDERTKLIINKFLSEYFKKPFSRFNKAHFNFVSDSIENFDDIEDFGDKCASVNRQIIAFIEALRKSIHKNYDITTKTIPQEWGDKKLLKLTIPGRVVINIKNKETEDFVNIIFDFITKEYTLRNKNGEILHFDIFDKNFVTAVKSIL